MPEEHTTELARLAGVSIMPWNSGFSDKGKPVKPAQVNRVLKVRVTLEEAEYMNGPSTTAVDKFNEGMVFYRKNTRDDNAEARKRFREATKLDPQFARAYVQLAATYRQDWNFEWTTNDPAKLSDIERQALLRGKEQVAIDLAQQSVNLDPSLPDGHVQLAYLYVYKMDYDQAEKEAREAIRLGGANYADGYAVLAQVLTYGGEPQNAVPLMEPLALDPQAPVYYLRQLGQAYYVWGQIEKYQKGDAQKAQECYQKAEEYLTRAMKVNPSHRQARLSLVPVYMESGQESKARGLFAEFPDMRRHITISQHRKQAPYKDQWIRERYIDALKRAGS
jgi:tetratricopeptide (TPR) repeat protein